VDKYKYHLVANGYSHVEGIYFGDFFLMLYFFYILFLILILK
jgi:hypothetical protein